MEYQVKELSNVEVEISVQVNTKEVDEAVNKAIGNIKKDLTMPGFRKGKVPNNVIEKRYMEDIMSDALDHIVNTNLDKILDDIDYFPANTAKFDGDKPVKDVAYSYKLTLDVLPKLNLPDLASIKIEEKNAKVEVSEVEDLVKQIHQNMAYPIKLEEDRPTKDGDFVILSFIGSDNGKEIDGLKVEFFTLKLGQKSAPEDFEALARGLKRGEKNSGLVYFDEEFPNKDIAGKKIHIDLEVHDIQAEMLPPLDDEVAKTSGFDTLEAMRDEIEKNILVRKARDYKMQAIDKMMNEILEPMSFDIPNIIIERQKRDYLLQEKRRLDLEGRTEENVAEELTKLEDTAIEKSHKTSKAQVLLLTIAFSNKMTVTEQEIDMRIYQQAQYAGEDFQKLRNIVWQSQMASELRDKILCDKAMDYIYSKVQKTIIE